jgi:hypothetical protein
MYSRAIKVVAACAIGLCLIVLPIVMARLQIVPRNGFPLFNQDSIRNAERTPAPITPKEESRLAALRIAGLHRDLSKMSQMIACLNDSNPTYVATGLHALEHLGNEQGIPDIDRVASGSNTDYIREEAKSAHARLMAETTDLSPTLPDERVQIKIDRYFSEEGLDKDKIVAGVLAFHSRGGSQGLSHEMNALREVADMAYRDSSTGFLSSPQLQGLDYSQDPGAALKVRLARMPQEGRLPWMINELANKKKIGKNEGYLLQLAVDEGEAASQAAGSKLREMDANREQYTYTGFSALFDVIRGVGDKRQTSLIAHFLNDQDTWIAYYAQQVYPSVKKGLGKQYAVGY